MAYAGLTLAFLLAWLAAPVEGGRAWWQTGLVAVFAALSIFYVFKLVRLSVSGGRRDVETVWKQIRQEDIDEASRGLIPASHGETLLVDVTPAGGDGGDSGQGALCAPCSGSVAGDRPRGQPARALGGRGRPGP